jgi:hypothetical protein
LKDPGDYQWHVLHQAKEIPYNEVVQWSFHPLGSKSMNSKAPQISDDMVNLISAAPIQPTTMMQRGADWFNNQGMSLTSRSVEQGISTISGDEDELEHGTSWCFVKSFVAAAELRLYSQQNDDETTDDEEGKDESKDENDTGRGREEKQQDEQDNEEKDAVDDEFPMYTIDVDQLLDGDPDYIDEVVHHLQGVEYSDEQVLSV